MADATVPETTASSNDSQSCTASEGGVDDYAASASRKNVSHGKKVEASASAMEAAIKAGVVRWKVPEINPAAAASEKGVEVVSEASTQERAQNICAPHDATPPRRRRSQPVSTPTSSPSAGPSDRTLFFSIDHEDDDTQDVANAPIQAAECGQPSRLNGDSNKMAAPLDEEETPHGKERRELEMSKVNLRRAVQRQQQVDESVGSLLRRLDELPIGGSASSSSGAVPSETGATAADRAMREKLEARRRLVEGGDARSQSPVKSAAEDARAVAQLRRERRPSQSTGPEAPTPGRESTLRPSVPSSSGTPPRLGRTSGASVSGSSSSKYPSSSDDGQVLGRVSGMPSEGFKPSQVSVGCSGPSCVGADSPAAAVGGMHNTSVPLRNAVVATDATPVRQSAGTYGENTFGPADAASPFFVSISPSSVNDATPTANTLEPPPGGWSPEETGCANDEWEETQSRSLPDERYAPVDQSPVDQSLFRDEAVESDSWCGWTIQTSCDGRLFYHHAESATSQWQMPSELTKVLGAWVRVGRDDKSDSGTYWRNELLGVSAWKDPRHTTNLFQAALDGNLFFLQLYAEVGGYLDAVDAKYRSAMHYNCAGGSLQAVTYLLQKSAAVNLQDHAGSTPLHWACRYGHAPIVRILLEARAYPDVQNSLGDTAMHEAAVLGRVDPLHWLVLASANPLLRNREDRTPAEVAARSQASDAEALLRNHERRLRWSRGARGKQFASKRAHSQADKMAVSGDLGEGSDSDPDTALEPSLALVVVRAARPLLRGVQWLANRVLGEKPGTKSVSSQPHSTRFSYDPSSPHAAQWVMQRPITSGGREEEDSELSAVSASDEDVGSLPGQAKGGLLPPRAASSAHGLPGTDASGGLVSP